jgi:Domain of unknown function (DUF4159)
MRRKRTLTFAIVLLLLAVTSMSVAQRSRRGRGGWRDRGLDWDDRRGVPMWENDKGFKDDVFTFVRIQFDSWGGRGWRRRGWSWDTDWPDSDLNFSFRLQQLTSLKVNPKPVILRLTEDELFDYPFIYIIEPGSLAFADDEVAALRKYLLNGGFLMVDDFWGDDQYQNFYEQIKRVFPEPEREPQELPLDHQIFNCVYRLKEKPQVPSIHAAEDGREYGITWEPYHGGDCQTVHFKGIFDGEGSMEHDRMMVIICHNTDLGDGWEREGESEWYFHEFAENKSYPMGINIVTYAMTH